uniref:Uncharacterized protein n=1 Tax=Opuntia streptacantha TaxID=393608 RepID=A0A7C9EWM4_OPUST
MIECSRAHVKRGDKYNKVWWGSKSKYDIYSQTRTQFGVDQSQKTRGEYHPKSKVPIQLPQQRQTPTVNLILIYSILRAQLALAVDPQPIIVSDRLFSNQFRISYFN